MPAATAAAAGGSTVPALASASGVSAAGAASVVTPLPSPLSAPGPSSAVGGRWAPLRTTRSSSQAALGAGPGGEAPSFYSILVHNLSHSDLMLGIRAPDNSEPGPASTATCPLGGPLPPSIIARPKFNRFKQISGRLLTYVENQQMQMHGVEFPSPLASKLTRATSQQSPASSASAASSAVAAAAPAIPAPVPSTCAYGFRVKDGQMKFQDWDAFKLKGEELAANSARMPKPEVIAAYFPMLAVLVPRWLSIVAGKNARRGIRRDDQNKKVLFLISGAGTPWNTDHDASGNSTKGVAKLATWWLHQFYPEIEVHTIHSGAEIFHYDANVQFVNKELRPRIEDVRRILAEKYTDRWPRYMHLAITLTDGASARISAINASLRHLTPDCLHMWQLKSFWHEYPHVTGFKGEADVEFHEFELLEMTPPTRIQETDATTKLLVREMIAHKEEFERVCASRSATSGHELDTFWLRKSKKPVLSVLMVKKKGRPVTFFRGINVEVSMPTGSLCSERNAIGSALSSDPALCRKDLRMIAVLALDIEGPPAPASTPTIKAETLSAPSHLVPFVAPMSPRSMPRRGVHNGTLALGHTHSHSGTGDDLTQLDSADAHMADSVELPSSVGARPNLQRIASDRSMLARQNSHSSSMPPPALPSSPALKGKQNSLTVPPSPKQGASPSKPVPMEDIESLTAAATSSATPRKRRAGAANLSVSPVRSTSPVATVDSAPTSAASLVSPRVTRNATPSTPVGAGTGAHALTGGSHSPRSLNRELHNSTLPTGPVGGLHTAAAAKVDGPSPAATPTPASPRMLTRSTATTPAKDEQPRASKRLKRSPSFDAGVAPEIADELLPHADALHIHPAAVTAQALNTVDERNPLGPCGSCNEWLKKIAEVNPDFKVVTFTGTDCQTVFVKAVKF